MTKTPYKSLRELARILVQPRAYQVKAPAEQAEAEVSARHKRLWHSDWPHDLGGYQVCRAVINHCAHVLSCRNHCAHTLSCHSSLCP